MPGISRILIIGRRQRAIGVAALLVAAYALVGGIAEAAGSGIDSSASVYSALTPFVVIDAKTIAAGATRTATVSGGTTAVPADATSVALLVSVSGSSSAGSAKINPYNDPADGFTAVQWAAGKPASAQVVVGVASNKVAIKNDGTTTVTVTTSVTGYYAPAGATGPAGGVLTGTYPDPGLAANAVTAANISGAGGTEGQILTNLGTGTTWTTPKYQSALVNTLVVHPTGNSTSDGDALRAAINAALPLVVVEPGVYDLGSTQVNVPSGTSIVGSGAVNTTLLFSGVGSVLSTTGTQQIAELKISSTGGAGTSRVITANSGSLTLRDVDLTVQNTSADQEVVSAGSTGSVTIYGSRLTSLASSATTFSQGVLQNGSSGVLTIYNSVINATSASSGVPADVVNAFGELVIHDSTVTATATNGGQAYGLYAQSTGPHIGTIAADDVQVSAATGAVTGAGSGTLKAANSMINGPAAGAVKCVDSYNGSYNPVSSTCS